MLDWLKNINKEYPDFYKTYLSKFELKSNRFVVLTTETTGLNINNDVILSIGAIAVNDDKIQVSDSFEIAIPQYRFLHDNGITNDFITESSLPKLVESEALMALLEFIENATLIGHRINFDIDMINEGLEKLESGKLKNEALDIEVMYKKLHDINDKDFSLNELTTLLKIPFNDRISASDDALTIAILFLKLKSKLHLEM